MPTWHPCTGQRLRHGWHAIHTHLLAHGTATRPELETAALNSSRLCMCLARRSLMRRAAVPSRLGRRWPSPR